MPERVRVHDQFRDTTAQSIGATPSDILELASDEVPFNDPATQTSTVTYTVAAKGAAVALVATPAITIPEDGCTVTAVAYTPAGNQAAPTTGNSRTYTLAGTEGTIATFVFGSVASAYATGVPVSFTVSHGPVVEQTLTLAAAIAGTGAADPGGVLTVTYTF